MIEMQLLEFGFQRDAIDEFHDEEICAVEYIEIKNLNDVGVPQARGRFGFVLKTIEEVGIVRQKGMEKFECDKTIERRLISFVNFRRRAAPDMLDDFIFANGLANERVCHGLSLAGCGMLPFV